MSTKIYTCICGKVCNSPAAFNGHKQGCSVHLINKYGSLEEYYKIKNRNHDRGEKVKQRSQEQKKLETNQWISESHRCEKCGVVMTQKWGSGRFCSHSCANSRSKSKEERHKIGLAVSQSEKFIKNNHIKRDYYDKQRQLKMEEYNKNPYLCEICGSILDYDVRQNKTCSKACENEWHRLFRNNYIAKNGVVESGKRGYKFGWYRGYHCDSSWELAFVMYHLDHNISIQRNNSKYFEYEYKGSTHKFFPDFIVEETFIEIKGIESEQCDCKVRDFPEDVPFKILYYPEVKPYLDYAENTYGKEFFYLYDEDEPSWMNSYDNAPVA